MIFIFHLKQMVTSFSVTTADPANDVQINTEIEKKT